MDIDTETPHSLRERAEMWRHLAGHESVGTADALLEAACELEMRARRLEFGARPPSAVRGGTLAGAMPRRWFAGTLRRAG